MSALPVLYSFRRCPYAMRARMALSYAGIDWEHREVLLKDKPPAMLALSPKGTVPVLQILEDSAGEPRVLDESIDIMHWALDQQDPDHWRELTPEQRATADALVERMEAVFKPNLDAYKYGHKLPQEQLLNHRALCEQELAGFNAQLGQQTFLLTPALSFVDVALFPFIRQFANVDRNYFDGLPHANLQHWLANLLDSELFNSIMAKHERWQEP